jgi:hypothetical protein
MRALKTITFIYVPKEDRIAAAVNAGHPDACSYWLTRRATLTLLKRAPEFLTSTSDLAQRAPVELRGDVADFERDAAIAQTAGAMTKTPPEVLKSSAASPELAERLTISPQGGRFQFMLCGLSGEGAAGTLTRAELQRIFQMIQEVVAKAGWLVTTAESATTQRAGVTGPKPAPH